jgi:hypothetical protein
MLLPLTGIFDSFALHPAEFGMVNRKNQRYLDLDIASAELMSKRSTGVPFLQLTRITLLVGAGIL